MITSYRRARTPDKSIQRKSLFKYNLQGIKRGPAPQYTFKGKRDEKKMNSRSLVVDGVLGDIVPRARLFLSCTTGGSLFGQGLFYENFLGCNKFRLFNLELLHPLGHARAKVESPIKGGRARDKGSHIIVDPFIEGRALDLRGLCGCKGNLVVPELLIRSS